MNLYKIGGQSISVDGGSNEIQKPSNCKERLSFTNGKTYALAESGNVVGAYSNGKLTQKTSYNGKCCAFCDCSENEIFRVRLNGGSSRSYCFVDSDYRVIEASATTDGVLDGYVIAPKGTAHAFFHSSNDYISILYKAYERKPYEVCLTKNPMQEFMETVFYNGNDDFSTTYIEGFLGEISSQIDEPNPVKIELEKVTNATDYKIEVYEDAKHTKTIDVYIVYTSNYALIYNLVPNRIYFYSESYTTDGESYIVLLNDEFKTSGAVRTLFVNGDIDNFRDVGGYNASDNKKVRYGLFYRNRAFGESISDVDKSIMINDLGIKSDVDIRTASEANNATSSPLGSEVEYNRYDVANAGYADALKKVYENVVNNKPMMIHCSAGADRTGLIFTYILALLGVTESDIRKDYELTSYSGVGTRRSDGGNTASSAYPNQFRSLKSKTGATLQDKAKTLFADLGFTETEINEFIEKSTY